MPAPGDVVRNPIDGLEYIWIPPGVFAMGAVSGDEAADTDERPQRKIEITNGFWLCRTEITVGAYERFAGKEQVELPTAWFGNPGWKRKDHPIVKVHWDDASAYCRWAGGRLPTEAEWEYAARGGVADRRYPFDKKTLTHADAKFHKARGTQRFKGTDPVDEARANLYGLLDMAGNVWEWVGDWYDEREYERPEGERPREDPCGPADGVERVVRGGSWRDQADELRVSNRRALAPDTCSRAVGFRCALDELPGSPDRVITYELRHVDLLRADADYLALKYPQDFHGVDALVARELGVIEALGEPRLRPWDYVLRSSEGAIGADGVLFVGVPARAKFGYEEIRRFAAQVLTTLAAENHVRTIAMTLHGAGLGLDLVEAAMQQCLGVMDALEAGRYPEDLQTVIVVEHLKERIDEAAVAVEEVLGTLEAPAGWKPKKESEWPIHPIRPPAPAPATSRKAIRAVASTIAGRPKQKPSVFVAMPFDRSMRTAWVFGILQPVRAAGLTCDRMDEVALVGDVMTTMKQMIDEADLVIADLTGHNANVFLEVGYAWGTGRPTLFVCQTQDDVAPKLPFDVANHACLFYEDAVELADKMTRWLEEYLDSS